MQEQYFSRITEGMDVYDNDGDKVGSVGRVYGSGGAAAAPGTATTTGYGDPTMRSDSAGAMAGREACLKVDTGFLGLGKDLFIPLSAVSDVTGDQVILNVDKDRVDDMGWDQRPSWLTDDMD